MCLRFMNNLFLIAAVSFLLTASMEIPAMAAPTITITNPISDSVVLTRPMRVFGTASGSNATWSQTTAADFLAGTRDNIKVNPSGAFSLDTGVYDDFEDGTLDPAKWTVTAQQRGLAITESSGVMKHSGTSLPQSFWMSYATVVSTAFATQTVSADMVNIAGSGTGYGTSLSLFQDDSNQVVLGLNYDPPAWGPGIKILLVVCQDVTRATYILGDFSGGSHNYKMIYLSGIAYIYQDDILIANKSISLDNYHVKISSALRLGGDSLTALWDNVRCLLALSGNLTSPVFDTGATDPVLNKINWTADSPFGSQTRVQMRSSRQPNMASATDWTTIMNGQETDLPAVKRYLQYRVTLTSNDGAATPTFDEITIDYHKPVVKVEVSTDNQMTWQLANGTTSWFIDISLPDGKNTVMVRATDATGMQAKKSLTFDVDATAPTASIIINEGAIYTDSPTIDLYLEANDEYGVSQMIISERQDFQLASWESYSPMRSWTLSDGDGPRTVFVKFRDIHGLESEPVNDSIILDTRPPVGSIIINEGAASTNEANVGLGFSATDLSGDIQMKVANSADFAHTVWRAYSPNLIWTLTPGSGEKKVFAMFKDRLGHISETFMDSIILDDIPPAVSLAISNGSLYTPTPFVRIEIQGNDNYCVSHMQLGTDPTLDSARWEPFRPTVDFELPVTDGLKTVYSRLRDAAGNEGAINSSSILLDTTAPRTTISPLPATTNNFTFFVKWQAHDSGSGVRYFDVQYRDGEGSWTDWLLQSQESAAAFTGNEDHTYHFRARAADRAGNAEPYPELPGAYTTLQSRSPSVSITVPALNLVVKGKIRISGTATHPQPGKRIVSVDVSLDDSPWQPATGTEAWELPVDTTNMSNGPHTIRVRAFDGKRYSEEVTSSFIIKNESPAKSTDSSFPILILLSIVILIGLSLGLAVASRRLRDRDRIRRPRTSPHKSPDQPGSQVQRKGPSGQSSLHEHPIAPPQKDTSPVSPPPTSRAPPPLLVPPEPVLDLPPEDMVKET